MIYQNDASGKTHLKGIEVGLKKYDVEMVASEGYEPKEVDLSSQVIRMKSSNVDALICSCAPEPAAKVYTERAKLGWKTPVVNVFFGKSPKVPELAGKKAVDGVYFATIFREWDDSNPKIQEAKTILKKYYPEEQPDAVHLWGFTGAQVFSEAPKRMGKDNIPVCAFSILSKASTTGKGALFRWSILVKLALETKPSSIFWCMA